MLHIVSASRRTDLPRCFPEKLADWLKAGRVQVKNPFNGKERQVDLSPESVHTLVLWSKDYAPLLDNIGGLKTQIKNYSQIYFHFTVTGLGESAMEPDIIPWQQAVSQFKHLLEIAQGPDRVNWRFDPIVFWKQNNRIHSNLKYFGQIAEVAKTAGIKQATVSLCQWYLKSQRRAELYKFDWKSPRVSSIKRIANWLIEESHKYNLDLSACCTSELSEFGIKSAKCINGTLLGENHPEKAEVEIKKDIGQRKECGCTTSVDIGSYQHSCPQGCVYCYANPKSLRNK